MTPRIRPWMWPAGFAAAFVLLALDVQFGGLVSSIDRPIMDEVASWSAGARHAWDAPRRLADTWSIVLVLFAGVVACILAKRPLQGLALFMVGTIEPLVVSGLKQLFDRARPETAFLHSPAFPSGHSAAAMTAYGLVVLVVVPVWTKDPRHRIAARIIAASIILAVATSSVLGGAHWPTDVMGGLLVGAVMVSAAVVLVHARMDDGSTEQPRQPAGP